MQQSKILIEIEQALLLLFVLFYFFGHFFSFAGLGLDFFTLESLSTKTRKKVKIFSEKCPWVGRPHFLSNLPVKLFFAVSLVHLVVELFREPNQELFRKIYPDS